MSMFGGKDFQDLMATVQDEANDFFLGEHIGRGMYRHVYAYARNPDSHVVKIEPKQDHTRFCNVQEWVCWQELKDIKRAARWLAPCTAISRGGSLLIQERTKPVMPDFLKGKLLPEWFDDTHIGNFGLLNGKIVCHDYAFNNLIVQRIKGKWDLKPWKD